MRYVLIPLLLSAAACDTTVPDDRILSAVDVEKAFASLEPSHALHRKGGSQSAGSANTLYERDDIYTVSGGAPLSDDFTDRLAKALAGQITAGGGKLGHVGGLTEIRHAKDFKHLGADSFGAKIQFS